MKLTQTLLLSLKTERERVLCGREAVKQTKLTARLHTHPKYLKRQKLQQEIKELEEQMVEIFRKEKLNCSFGWNSAGSLEHPCASFAIRNQVNKELLDLQLGVDCGKDMQELVKKFLEA